MVPIGPLRVLVGLGTEISVAVKESGRGESEGEVE